MLPTCFWTSANDGSAEVQGENDAVAEEKAPQTPRVEDDDGGWGAPAAGEKAQTSGAGNDDGGWGAPEVSTFAETNGAAFPAAEPETAAEPEEVQKSYDEFLAERAQAALSSGLGKKEGRQVNAETLEGKAFRREAAEDTLFSGKVCHHLSLRLDRVHS